MNTRVLLLALGCAAVAWSFREWRKATLAAMLLLVFEGAIRKWIFPGAQDLVYFAKDGLLLGAYAGFFADRDRPGRRRAPRLPALFAALTLAVTLGGLAIFNPRLPSLLVGVLGFKAYFFYIPLLFLVPAVFRDRAELDRFLRRYALIAVPVGLLAIAQFVAPSSSALNTYARGGADVSEISTFGSSTHVRVTSTFSYITGYTSYLFAQVTLLLGILGAVRWRFRRANLPLFAALGMCLLGFLMSGSRGPVLLLAIVTPIYLWFAVFREQGGGGVAGRLIFGSTILAAFVAYAGADALGAFLGRAAGHGDVAERLVLPFTQPLRTLERAGLLGYGIGATHQMALAVVSDRPPYSWLEGATVEDESGRVMLELGPLGFTLIYFIRLYLVGWAFREAGRQRTVAGRSLSTACLLFFLAQLPSGIIFDVTSGLYYWFFAGLLSASAAIDREEAQREEREEEAARRERSERERPRAEASA